MPDDVLELAKSYLLHNAAESGADELIIALTDELASARTEIARLKEALERTSKHLADMIAGPDMGDSHLQARLLKIRVVDRALSQDGGVE